MKKIMIFSGTTEGRRLSEMLSEDGISHFLSVATEYGCDVMPGRTLATINIGRMDSDGMVSYLSSNGFGQDDIVVDATHPYAVEVSENAAKSAKKLGCRLYRIERPSDDPDGCDVDAIRYYDSIDDFATHIEKEEGNILLTTGSNTLRRYCNNVSAKTLSRTFIRVLPTVESIEACTELGVENCHIIAMQGPFSCEMNKALIKQYNISHMLTKESGATGGFSEKIRAASQLGVHCHVISRPQSMEGMSIGDVYAKITGRPYEQKLRLIIAGAGMGSSLSQTVEAAKAIRSADAVFGAKRLTDGVLNARKYDMYRAEDIIPVLEKNRDIRTAVVLFSGDTGFYSGAKEAYRQFAKWRKDALITVLPGISSVSYLAAKLGESYEDAAVISLHGKNAPKDFHALIDTVRFSEKTFVLCSGDSDVTGVARLLSENGINAEITAASRLSYDDETIENLSVRTAMDYKCSGIITMFIKNRGYARRPLIRMKSDDDFIRDDVPMTKESIRHESIIRLGLRKGDTFWDIGGGTGSVAIEAAGLDPSLNVITIEKDPKAADLIKKNIEKSGADNVTVIEGDAFSVIPELDKPDCVFVGGSGGDLKKIVSLISEKGEGIRYAVNAVTLETIEEVNHIMAEYGVKDPKITQLTVSQIRSVGMHHMLHAQNPVMICSFTI